MSDHEPECSNTPPDATQDDAIDQSRRKLTGAALGVSAVFTLASRPVWAGKQCFSASGFQSGNLSRHGTPVTCSGNSPGYWKQHPEAWSVLTSVEPGTCASECNKTESWTGGTLFHPFFAGDNFMANLDSNSTTDNTSLSMMQVMQMNDGSNPWGLTDTANLGSHIVAALLNARAGYTDDVLDETAVIGMWNEWQINGYFEPTAGVQWGAAQIVTYIISTFG